MANTTANENIGYIERLRRMRRRQIKIMGRALTRRLSTFLGQQSLVGDTPVLDSKHFPFLQDFSDNWEKIRDEAQGVLKFRDEIPAFQEVSPDQKRISKGKNWRTFILYGFGNKLEKNCKHAPYTTQLLEKVPNMQTAWFSILSPGYHIPAHKGVSMGIVRAHVGLIIPKEPEKCRIRIEDQIKVWREGETFAFCDAFEHEVWNDTDEERVILLFDFDRPMKFWGRFINNSFLRLMKMTAFYQEPKKNIANFEDRYEAAAMRANENYEKMSQKD